MRERRFQFKLFTYLAIVTAAAALILLVRGYNRCERQLKGIERVRELGAVVDVGVGGPSWIPLRYREFWFTTVFSVRISGKQFGDGELASLRDVPVVDWLEITDTHLTDNGLGFLAAQSGLRCLLLEGCQLTDDAIAKIETRSLMALHITRCPVTDAGLQHLRPSDTLELLWLEDTQLSDGAIDYLVEFPKLVDLNLSGTRITDMAMAKISKIHLLEGLCVERTKVTDAGAMKIVGLTHLRVFSASGSQITAKGLAGVKDSCPDLICIGLTEQSKETEKSLWPLTQEGRRKEGRE
jgi:hypothetical protein